MCVYIYTYIYVCICTCICICKLVTHGLGRVRWTNCTAACELEEIHCHPFPPKWAPPCPWGVLLTGINRGQQGSIGVNICIQFYILLYTSRYVYRFIDLEFWFVVVFVLYCVVVSACCFLCVLVVAVVVLFVVVCCL